MTSLEPKMTPQEEYIRIEADVRKITFALRSRGLTKKLVKLILLSQDWEDRKAHSMEEIISSFFPALVKVSILSRVIL